MRARQWLPHWRQLSGRWLTVLLLATPFASVIAPWLGWRDYEVFGLARGARAALFFVAAALWLASWVNRPSARRARRRLAEAATLVALAFVQAWIIERHANLFYTPDVLVEGVTLLLALHVAAELLRRVDGGRRAVLVVDDIDLGAALLVLSFWPAAAAGWHNVAGILLILAAPLLVLAALMRGAGAMRPFDRRARRQAPPPAPAGSDRSLRQIGIALLLATGGAAVVAWRTPASAPPLAAPALDDRCMDDPIAARTPAGLDGPRVRLAAARDAAPPGALRLSLNLPAFRLDAVRDDVVVRSFGVAVGMRRYATPVGDFEITRIVWNPWWYPPDREWARHERITPPGPTNPMGRVKLLMRGPYYLHGSPYVASIGQAASHGCIRMLDASAIELARLLQRETGAALTDAAVDSLTTSLRETREVELPVPVPLRIVYELAELRQDSLLLHADVYRRAGGPTRAAALDALARAGLDPLAVRTGALDSLVRRARGGHAAAPVAALLRLPPGETPTTSRFP